MYLYTGLLLYTGGCRITTGWQAANVIKILGASLILLIPSRPFGLSVIVTLEKSVV